jgi:hypothetical protein
MAYQLTTATKKLARLNKRLRGVAGGTSAGKTISILHSYLGSGPKPNSYPQTHPRRHWQPYRYLALHFKKAGGTLTLSTGAGQTDVITARWDGTNWVEVSRALNVS